MIIKKEIASNHLRLDLVRAELIIEPVPNFLHWLLMKTKMNIPLRGQRKGWNLLNKSMPAEILILQTHKADRQKCI